MLHILGYAHEQTRPDRDSYVKIHWDRIQRDSLSNFFKSIYDNATVIPPKCQPWSNATTFDDCYSGFTIDTFGYAYDYGSVMHYGLADFQTSDNNTMDALRFVPSGIQIGQRNGMTELDALKVKAKYKCDQLSTLSTTRPTQVTTKVCKDKWPYCDSMKKYCFSEYTGGNCPQTCNKCPEDISTTTTICKDKLPYCDILKEWCFSEYTSENCPQTCKKCPEDINTTTTTSTTAITTTSDCFDKYETCGKYLSHCSDKIMTDNCPSSCKLCPAQEKTTIP
ncbi:zinc metalloproteinase nas-15-like [Lepeophtheirus salmonis]|uniref:zinc metalloproteinase nas-15-like n=1 Tax=Lepeophtheirus salmonis TaxID=72036 RepID=UPI003AF33A30